MYKYKFDSSSKKFLCPACGKKRFVRYIDANNNYLPEHLGKCDREANCCYEQKPDVAIEINLEALPKVLKYQKPDFINSYIVQQSLSGYDSNSFYQYLTTKFEENLVKTTFQKYCVGTSKHWGGSPVFWQTDLNGNVRSGKVVKYVDGDRVTKPFNHVNWAHKLLKLKDFNLVQVMFGSHCLKSYKGDVVCIVESEKTAMVMDMYCPGLLWLSIGSLTMLSYERLKFLKGFNIILYPDTDGDNKWKERAQAISSKIGQQIHVSELVKNQTILFNQKEGFDLADIVLGKVKMKCPPEKSDVEKAIQQLMVKNRAIDALIQTFDLDTNQATLKNHKL
ncbi:DUF6371 domain-containing protein [Crocinitomicaceae bacterium]|jgi:hypothetical protein|nr:DUF6371 domain-containing protein [Crocinitomicaceae bacterium]MDB4606830.1 DUF6371 domain-containing protein [Crocinitomicaceae bacterium]